MSSVDVYNIHNFDNTIFEVLNKDTPKQIP